MKGLYMSVIDSYLAGALGTFTFLAALGAATDLAAQDVAKGFGTPMSFDIGYGIFVNKGSSMQRTWVISNEPDFPVQVEGSGFNGLRTVSVNTGYQHQVDLKINVSTPVTAVEIVIIPFDLWNDRQRPLSLSEIRDMPPGSHELDGAWNIFSDSDALETMTAFVYVDRVRLISGEVRYTDRSKILAEAQKISRNIKEADLQPPPPKAD